MPEPVIDTGVVPLTEQQLESFVRLRERPDMYVSRIVEHLEFLPGGGQRWRREVQVQIPGLDSESDEYKNEDVPFVVSLGRFHRRRFPDFEVTTANGTRCHLVSRQQHGECMAFHLLRPLLSKDEWSRASTSEDSLNVLTQLNDCLSRMVTTIGASCSPTPLDARIIFDELLMSLNIDQERTTGLSESFYAGCNAALGETQYLCWVSATPGDTICLRATYTQAELPEFKDEPNEVTTSKVRLWWRNLRTKQYAKHMIFPLRYTLSTPAYRECRSYYFAIAPPLETKIVLLDWDKGHRVHTASGRNTDWSRNRRWEHFLWKPALVQPFSDELAEIDCARFTYHFHNRRIIREAASREQRERDHLSERRKLDVDAGVKLHAFMRPDTNDNGRFVAIGCLGLALAFLAERGALFANTGGSSVSQWLLLTPAVMLVFVAQQQRHHYARFTGPFRKAVWLYLTLAMLFAASIAFSITSIPLIYGSTNEVLARSISATFALASSIIIVLSAWSGKHFENVNRHRHRRVLERVRVFATPSTFEVWGKYRRKPTYWKRINAPLPLDEIGRAKLKGSNAALGEDPRENHPSNRIYAAVTRHNIDRVLAGVALVVACISLTMPLHVRDWHWGLGEECAIEKEQKRQLYTERGKSLGSGICENGHWVKHHK